MDDTKDINQLIHELNAGVRSVAVGVEAARLSRWLEQLLERRGSDLLLVAGAPPAVRVDGRVVALPEAPLSGEEIEEAVLPVLSPRARSAYVQDQIADASYKAHPLGRFRINLHRERGRAAATVRALPVEPPRLSTLRLPPAVESLTKLPRGLVLLGGPTGSGKTTTLAALVEEINCRDARHIVTIEDPIEYEHPHRSSLIEQVDRHGRTGFPDGAARRDAAGAGCDRRRRDARPGDDADRFGRRRDRSPRVLDGPYHGCRLDRLPRRRLLSGRRQATIRQELSMSLAGVLTQILLPKKGGGRVPAAELLLVGYGTRQHIRKNALQHLHQEIALTRKAGSLTLEESLARLVKDGLVEVEEARSRAAHPEEFENLLRG